MNSVASMSAPAKGIVLMIVGGLVLTMSDTATKWLAGNYPVGQIMGIRALFTLIPLSLFVWQNGGLDAMQPQDVERER